MAAALGGKSVNDDRSPGNKTAKAEDCEISQQLYRRHSALAFFVWKAMERDAENDAFNLRPFSIAESVCAKLFRLPY